MRGSLVGGDPTLLAVPSAPVAALAAIAGSVYWAEDSGERAGGGTIERLAAGDAQPVVLATAQRGPRAFAFSATHVYWADFGTAAWDGDTGGAAWRLGDGSVRRLPR
jgi:hypothetical protein